MKHVPLEYQPDREITFGKYTGTLAVGEKDWTAGRDGAVHTYHFDLGDNLRMVLDTSCLPTGHLYRLTEQSNPRPRWESYIAEYSARNPLRYGMLTGPEWLHSDEINADAFFREAFENVERLHHSPLESASFFEDRHPYLPDLDEARCGVYMTEMNAQLIGATAPEMWREGMPDTRWLGERGIIISSAMMQSGLKDFLGFGLLAMDPVINARTFKHILFEDAGMTYVEVEQFLNELRVPIGFRRSVLKS